MITNFKLTHYSELKLVHLKLKTPHFKKKTDIFVSRKGKLISISPIVTFHYL